MIQALCCHHNMVRPMWVAATTLFSLVSFFGNFTLRPHIFILLIVLINLLVQFFLVYNIWVHIPKSGGRYTQTT
jgi:hypothetical protein